MAIMPVSFLILIVPLVLVGLILLIIKKTRLALIILGTLVLFPVAFIMLMMLIRFFGVGLGGAMGGARLNLSIMSIMVLPLIFALIVGFIYMLVKYPKAGLITLGVIVLAVLGVLGMFTCKAVPVSPTPIRHVTGTAVTATNGHAENIIRNEEELTAIWREGIEDEFEVDVYPSQKAAARQLGKQIVELATKLNGGKEPEWFEVSLVANYEHPEVNAAYTKAIEDAKSNPDNPILTSAKGLKEDVATVGLVRTKHETINGVESGGTLQASVYVKGKRVEITSQYSEKPWLENFSAYTNSNPGRQYVVVRSKSSCTNADQARREAKTAATRVLVWKLHDMGAGSSVNFGDIEKHGFIADKFAQSLKGSVSQIYRQAILLDVSGDKMKKLARDKQNRLKETLTAKAAEIQYKRFTWARMLISLVGLITVICVVYLIVNVATKGYYTLVLRLVTAALIVIGAIVLFLLLFCVA